MMLHNIERCISHKHPCHFPLEPVHYLHKQKTSQAAFYLRITASEISLAIRLKASSDGFVSFAQLTRMR